MSFPCGSESTNTNNYPIIIPHSPEVCVAYGLKGLAQTTIIKKAVILFRVLNMTI